MGWAAFLNSHSVLMNYCAHIPGLQSIILALLTVSQKIDLISSLWLLEALALRLMIYLMLFRSPPEISLLGVISCDQIWAYLKMA